MDKEEILDYIQEIRNALSLNMTEKDLGNALDLLDKLEGSIDELRICQCSQ
jgi:hypothetical protein